MKTLKLHSKTVSYLAFVEVHRNGKKVHETAFNSSVTPKNARAYFGRIFGGATLILSYPKKV